MDELSVTIKAHNFPDVVCIVESWLSHDVRDQELQFQTLNVTMNGLHFNKVECFKYYYILHVCNILGTSFL